MLDEREIDIEIAKWEYLESSYDNYAKLANLYTIRDHVRTTDTPAAYSAAPAERLGVHGDSDFLRAIADKSPADILPVIDDLMDTLCVANPRVYNGVMRKINNIG